MSNVNSASCIMLLSIIAEWTDMLQYCQVYVLIVPYIQY